MHLEPLIAPSLPLTALALGIDLATVVAGVQAIRRSDGSPRQWLMVIVVLAVGAVFGGIVARVGFGSLFATLRVWTHLLWFAAVPLFVVLAASGLRRGDLVSGAVAIVVAVGLLTGLVWSHFVEPRALEVTQRTWQTDRLPAGAAIRIAVLADIQTDHVGGYEAAVIERTRAMRPDLVLLPGDFIQFRDRERFLPQRDRLVALLETLDPPLGIWAVPGDVDYHPDIFDGTRIRMLVDEVAAVPGAPGLRIAGLSLAASRRPPDAALDAMLASSDGLTILLGHAPDGALPWIRGDRGDPALYVAGHTHGGQVVVPGFGPPITLSAVPREVAAGGLFRYGDAAVLVSRGVGHERGWAPRLRFACRPELAIVDLSGPTPDR